MTRSSLAKRIVILPLAALTAIGAVLFAWIWLAPCWLGGCAPLDDLAEYQAEGSQLLDIHDQPFGTLATVNRRVVPLDSLPPHLPQAFVAVEDQRFYDHSGLDFQRVLGALLSNVQAGGVAEGGSTITMQLARNLFPEWLPYTQRNLRRKLLEARAARQLERAFSKDKILELYLNHIYLGNGAYGVEAAAQAYFGKPAAELTLAEAATLGGLPKAPSNLDPTENPEGARERRNLVLGEMVDAGFISSAEAQEARDEPLRLAETEGEGEGPIGSYFVEQVRREMEELVGNRFYTSGLRIRTTLDPTAQRAAEEELARQLDAIEAGRFGTFRHPTYPEDKEEDGNGQTRYLQGAVVLMDAATGEVRAMVGGRDFQHSKFNRAMQALRQPGSAFKPFVYLNALNRFGSPAHIVEDAPIRMVLSGGRVWEPKNYTGQYEGQMTMRDALARSKNTVTVRLAEEVGMDRVASTARELGISTDIPRVPSAALGAADVRPIEMAQAYAAFANGGMRVQPRFIREVVDRHGRVLWRASGDEERVLDPAEAFVLTTMLQDVVDRGSGTAVRAVGFGGPAAGKTGTTNDATDVWFVGYTPELVGTVWIGLDRPQTIVRGASGGTLAAPVWGRIMRRVYQDRGAPPAWQPPSGVSTAQVERATGRVVGENCPAQGPTYTEYFLGAAPAAVCAPPAGYPTYSVGDSIWGDEEWAADLPPMDTSMSAGSGEIDWPELEAIRRRSRMAGEPAPAPEAAGSAESESAQTRSTPPPARAPQAEEAEEEAEQARERERPRLLGEPVRRDNDAPADTARTSAP